MSGTRSYVVVLTFVALSIAPYFAHAASLPGGVFNLIMRSDGLCMDVYANQAVSGQNIDNWHCNGTTAQTFRAESLGGDVYRIINTNSGMCVDVYGNDTSEGADVVQAWCNGSSAQSFQAADAGSGYVYLVNTNSGKCVGFGGTFQWQNTDQGNWQWVPDVRMYSCNGAADRQWYPAAPASCSISLSPNPKDYAAAATLSWSSSYANSWLYINNVGYVGASGAVTVAPTSNTDYSCVAYGSGGSDGWHSAILYVNAPSNCTAPWGSAVSHGSSVIAYQAATVPYGSLCVSQTRSCSNGSLSDSYEYQSCSVDNPAPTCSISVAPTTITSGESSTLTWSSSNATTCTGTNFSTGGATSGSTSVSPSSSTNYSASCTGTGGTTACTDTSSGGGGDTTATLSVACTESWACTGAGGSTITHTLANCSTETIDTCVSPEFCTTGSALCLYDAVTGSITASPRLVTSGKTTTVSWSTDDAVSCTVTGNGDTWIGTSGSQTSSPITELTTYTIRCDDGDPDTTQDDFTDKVHIVRLPGWLEL
ncbi:RICIN domain-containing protein [Candidatus Kaiserbacteria bacterium]|nr:RICIN domain-containing protein [Candidatus Kaiserbacteria bacterium]